MSFEISSRFNSATGRHELIADGDMAGVTTEALAEATVRYVRDKELEKAFIRGVPDQLLALLLREPGFRAGNRIETYRRSRPFEEKADVAAPLRPATPEDVPAMTALINGAYPDKPECRFPEDWVRQDLFDEGMFNIVAEDAGRPVGFGCAVHGGDEGEVNWVCVAPARRRRGLGAAILRCLLTELSRVPHQRIELTVDADNIAAAALYRRFAFTPCGDKESRVLFDSPRDVRT